jgi:hypothetical protein
MNWIIRKILNLVALIANAFCAVFFEHAKGLLREKVPAIKTVSIAFSTRQIRKEPAAADVAHFPEARRLEELNNLKALVRTRTNRLLPMGTFVDLSPGVSRTFAFRDHFTDVNLLDVYISDDKDMYLEAVHLGNECLLAMNTRCPLSMLPMILPLELPVGAILRIEVVWRPNAT